MKRLLVASFFSALILPAQALDDDCQPLVAVSEAKLAQPAWHSVTLSAGLTLEAMKVNGLFFMRMDGNWQRSPMNLDEAERIAIASMEDGSIKISDCKEEGTQTLDGVKMQVFSYTSEMPGSGMPASTAKLYLGKGDGLPYLLTTDDGVTKVMYRYKDVVAPTVE